MAVPLFATEAALRSLKPEVGERIQAVLGSGRYILGEECEAFEAEFAAYLGAAHCVGVANGTDALMIALLALGVTAGDEVVVPAVSFFATAEAVAAIGASPVFADVEPGTWCLSAATVEPVLSGRTKAIIPVHLFGNPAPMVELARLADDRGLALLEDAAQAAGARLGGRRAGTLGRAGTFSFYPGKNLGAIGDGGAVVTDDAGIAATVRRLRNHGSADQRIHTQVGFNSRLDEIQAAALRVHLRRLDAWTAARREAVGEYERRGLGELVGLPAEGPEAESCFHQLVVASAQRERLQRDLAAAGIESRVYYTPVLSQQPAMRAHRPTAPTPGAERYARTTLALPIGQSLTAEQIGAVVGAARASLC